LSGPRIGYALAMSRPHTHLFEVTITIDGWSEPRLDLVMPSWTPGSYMIREYARHVQEFAVTSDGHPARWEKTAKDAWRVETPLSGRVRVSYRVYANDLTVRTCHLDGTHGFANGAAVFLYIPGRTQEAVTLEVAVPAKWQVATGLESTGGGNGVFRFRARDYDELVDRPGECGPHRGREFEVDGIPHRIALWGRGNEDELRLTEDTRALVRAQREFFGGVPYKRYTFIHHLASGRGGLEHRNSAVFLVDRFGFRPRASYERYLELVSHEFFHVWNVKRIRPKPLGPFDYRSENHTRQLWTMEGVTSYYEKRFVVAAGLYTKERFLERIAEEISSLQAQPGRGLQSLEQASFDAWIKFYRPDENSANASISYYQKGALVAMLLDLEIRALTSRAKCLDDVVKHLAHSATLDDAGFAEPDGYLAAVEAVAGEQGGAFKTFFERYVSGTAELDYERALGHAGLTLAWTRADAKEGDRPGWLGATTRQEGRTLMVASVRASGPAEAAGLYAGDEILALDGVRVDAARLSARLAERSSGATVRVAVFRRDELFEIPVTLTEVPSESAAIVPREGATPEQAALREAWLAPFQR
jgi:predicted metalloprotease with PDZ domain